MQHKESAGIKREDVMSKVALSSIHIEDALATRLAHLAKATHCTKSFIASQAIEEYLTLHEWQVQAIEQGLSEIDRGAVVGHDEMISSLAKWGRKESDAA
jgi:predicted transcriptional regulator